MARPVEMPVPACIDSLSDRDLWTINNLGIDIPFVPKAFWLSVIFPEKPISTIGHHALETTARFSRYSLIQLTGKKGWRGAVIGAGLCKSLRFDGARADSPCPPQTKAVEIAVRLPVATS